MSKKKLGLPFAIFSIILCCSITAVSTLVIIDTAKHVIERNHTDPATNNNSLEPTDTGPIRSY